MIRNPKTLKKVLKNLGYTQARIARELNYTRQYVNNVMCGRVESLKIEDYIMEIIENVART